MRGANALLIEQNVKQALSVVDRGCALEMGCNRYEATSDTLLADEEVSWLHLGSDQ